MDTEESGVKREQARGLPVTLLRDNMNTVGLLASEPLSFYNRLRACGIVGETEEWTEESKGGKGRQLRGSPLTAHSDSLVCTREKTLVLGRSLALAWGQLSEGHMQCLE